MGRENNLTEKQKLFVSAYLKTLNATKAAQEAGYSSRNASKIGFQLLEKPRIRAAIEEAQQARQARTLVTVDYVVSSLREVVERCLQRVPVVNMRGEQVQDEEGRNVWKFDSTGANKALELLGRHVNAFGERKEEQANVQPAAIEIVVVDGRVKRE